MADIQISNIILLKLLDCMKNNQNYFSQSSRKRGIPTFKPNFQELGSSAIFNTDKTATKLSQLIKNIDSDIYGIQGSASEKGEMLFFNSTYLYDKCLCEIGIDGNAQKLYFFYKKIIF